MDKQKVMHIIRETPYADLLEFLLGRCNLSEKERSLINARIAEDVTQEQYAETIQRSPRYVQEMEKRALGKIIVNWSTLDWLEHL